MRYLLHGLLVWMLCGAHSASAQDLGWLPPPHWSGPLLTRLHALGRTTIDPAITMWTAGELMPILPERERLRLELEHAPGSATAFAATGAFIARRDAVTPGRFTSDQQWIEPAPVPDRTAPALRVRARVQPTGWLAVNAAATAMPDAAILDHATLDGAAGPVHFWAGRRALGYRPGTGGIVLGSLARFEGAGVRTLQPIAVPLAGSVRIDAFAGLLDGNGRVASPWLLGMRLHARPHGRFDVGVTRAAMFGGMDGADTGVRQWLEVLVGGNLEGSYADDQVASADARWRPALVIPLELYGEWGMHDIDIGVLLDVPAFTVGLRLPRGTDFMIGIEHTQFSGSCCGNPPWYHHFELSDGWTAERALLGHPLGGHGREWRITASGALHGNRMLYGIEGAHRTRGDENLLSPLRQGRAFAAAARLDALLPSAFAAGLLLHYERGSGWHELRAFIGLRRRL